MSSSAKTPDSSDTTRPRRRRRRWLRRIAVTLVTLTGIVLSIYAVLRFVYPRWVSTRLPPDAPRIAFSLDNSLIGWIGVTDVTYQRVMAKAGGRLIALRPDAAGDPEVDPQAVETLLETERIDAVLLAGGGDIDPNVYGGQSDATMLVHRLRDDFEIALIHAARERGLPILGICRGCQILNVALGGTVRNLREEPDVKAQHFDLSGHAVELVPDSALAEILGVTGLPKVVSLHGQAVGALGAGIRVAATGPGGVIEAIEADTAIGRGWIIGLQWHPELTLDEKIQHNVFRTLVNRARKTITH